MYDDCPQLLRDFLFYMKTIKGRSDRTVDGYYIDLKNFLKYQSFIKNNCDNKWTPDLSDLEKINIESLGIDFLSQIKLSDVYEYLNYAMSERLNNANTRARKVSALRTFFGYLTTTVHALENNPIKELEVPSIKKSLPKYLSLDESLKLINATVESKSARDYCIVTLFLNCGMRLSELIGINLQDFKENSLRILGKGNKERILYLNQACIDAINNYKSTERSQIHPKPGNENALFLSKQGTRISGRRVEQIVESYLKDADLSGQGYSPHKLRHTAATLLYQHGNVDVRILKELLGHESLSTTEIYTHVSNKQLENASNKSPLANVSFKSLSNDKNDDKSVELDDDESDEQLNQENSDEVE